MEILLETLYRGLISTYRCSSTDQTRPHLNCVCVETEGKTVRCVSTNAHVLAKFEDTGKIDNEKTQILIMLDDVKTLLKALKKDLKNSGSASVFLEIDGQKLTVKYLGNQFTYMTPANDFPNYSQVIPTYTECKTSAIGVDANYLKVVSDCYKPLVDKDKMPAVKMEFNDELDPILFTSNVAPLLIVVMPVRV